MKPRRRRPASGYLPICWRDQCIADEEVPVPPVHAGFVAGVDAPQLARGGVGGVVTDGDALASLVAHQEEVAVACDVRVDHVQISIVCIDFPGQAHTVDVVARKKASVLGVAVVAPRAVH